MDEVIINIPYFYQANIVRKRCRKPISINVLGINPVAIPNIVSDEDNVVGSATLKCERPQENIVGAFVLREINNNICHALSDVVNDGTKNSRELISQAINISLNMDDEYGYGPVETYGLTPENFQELLLQLNQDLSTTETTMDTYLNHAWLQPFMKKIELNGALCISDDTIGDISKVILSDTKEHALSKLENNIKESGLCVYNGALYMKPEIPVCVMPHVPTMETESEKIGMYKYSGVFFAPEFVAGYPYYMIDAILSHAQSLYDSTDIHDSMQFLPNMYLNIYNQEPFLRHARENIFNKRVSEVALRNILSFSRLFPNEIRTDLTTFHAEYNEKINDWETYVDFITKVNEKILNNDEITNIIKEKMINDPKRRLMQMQYSNLFNLHQIVVNIEDNMRELKKDNSFTYFRHQLNHNEKTSSLKVNIPKEYLTYTP